MSKNEECEDGEELIARVKANYSSCQSYSDRGQLTSILPQDEAEPLISYQTFSTAFVRPDRFRFEFRDRFPEGQFGRHVVWREDDLVKAWGYQFHPKVRVESDLSLALLPQEITVRGLFDGSRIEVIGNEEFQEQACLKVRSQGTGNYFVWIEIESGLILGVEEHTPISYQDSGWTHSMIVGHGSLTSRTIIKYHPAINVEIPVSSLEFGEPFAGY